MKRLLFAFVILMSGSLAHAYDANVLSKIRSLENAAYRAADSFETVTGYSHISSDARRFAREVSHLHDSISSGAREYNVKREFKYLRNKYYHLISTFKRAHDAHHNPRLVDDIDRVKYSYRNLRDEMFKYEPK